MDKLGTKYKKVNDVGINYSGGGAARHAGVEKIADHGTNGPRNFFRSPERMKRKKRNEFREANK